MQVRGYLEDRRETTAAGQGWGGGNKPCLELALSDDDAGWPPRRDLEDSPEQGGTQVRRAVVVSIYNR